VLGIPLDKSRTDHLVVAVVQPSAGSTIDEAGTLGWAEGRPSSYKVPHHIMVFAPEDIPITGSGKVKRPKLQELVAERLALSAGEPAPRPAGQRAIGLDDASRRFGKWGTG